MPKRVCTPFANRPGFAGGLQNRPTIGQASRFVILSVNKPDPCGEAHVGLGRSSILAGGIMGLDIEAVYHDGVLRLEREIPLENGQRVRLTIHPPGGRVEKAFGLMGWQGTSEEFHRIALNPEFGILESP